MTTNAFAGGEHTLYKSKDGKLSSAGACGLGWCRLQSLNPSLFKFRQVQIPEPVSLVHASYYHNLAVGKHSGSLYSWGCGTFTDGGLDGVIPALAQGVGAQDVGTGPKVANLPRQTTAAGSAETIQAVTGGAYHSVVLMNTGRILTFGAGQLGQLGRSIPRIANQGDTSGLPVDPQPTVAAVPTLNEKETCIEKVGAGFYNTFGVCNRGKLFCTGENQNRQCGNGPKNLHTFTQVREVDHHKVDQVEGGYCHTLVKTLAGKVFSLGCGDDGQRGDSREGDDPDRPVITPVALPVAAAQVAAGANHSVILGEDGNVFTFGANDVGQCGVPSDPPVSDPDDDDEEEGGGPVLTPKKVDLPLDAGKVVHVSAGYAHTVLTTDSGKIFVFGQNDNGQLGFGADVFERGKEPEAQTTPVEVYPQE